LIGQTLFCEDQAKNKNIIHNQKLKKYINIIACLRLFSYFSLVSLNY